MYDVLKRFAHKMLECLQKRKVIQLPPNLDILITLIYDEYYQENWHKFVRTLTLALKIKRGLGPKYECGSKRGV